MGLESDLKVWDFLNGKSLIMFNLICETKSCLVDTVKCPRVGKPIVYYNSQMRMYNDYS